MRQSTELLRPAIPNELAHYLEDPYTADVLQDWREVTRPVYSYEHISSIMPPPQVFNLGDRRVRAVVLNPDDGLFNESQTIVMTLPHQQAWKPSMYLRAELMRKLVAPNSQAIIFPNNSHGAETYYSLTIEERERMDQGDITPLGDLQARVLEELHILKVMATGYSLGAIAAFGLAAKARDFDITTLNADEMPSADRDAKQLQKDFTRSGGFFTQLGAIDDSRIPASIEALSPGRLIKDYINFGLSLRIPENKALHHAMAGSAHQLVESALTSYPKMAIKIGYVANSRLFDPATVEGVKIKQYHVFTDRQHTLADNIVAHALMARDGLDPIE
jgi:hypothetical protein